MKRRRPGAAITRGGIPFFIVTHRPAEVPADAGFEFVDGLDEAIARAREAAGDLDVFVMGGADVIRQALRAGYVEELTITIAPVVLGGANGTSTTSTSR
jgi:dihydrofolate reductase